MRALLSVTGGCSHREYAPAEEKSDPPSPSATISPRRDMMDADRSEPAPLYPRQPRPGEWLGLLLILALAAWLRLSRLDLVEFKADEAEASMRALDFVHTGFPPARGLTSSVGVYYPPLLIDLLGAMFRVSPEVSHVAAVIALLGTVAVLISWHIGRVYYGPSAGLTAALLFAVSPWAVIYSRKIWGPDLLPICGACLLWALHGLTSGRRPRVAFWVVLLTAIIPQLHFIGVATGIAVLGILLVLRPRIQWGYAAAALVVGVLPLIPYLAYEAQHDWTDLRQVGRTGPRFRWDQPGHLLTNSHLGVPALRETPWEPLLAVTNAGELEDLLGWDAEPFQREHPLSEWFLGLERWLLLLAGLYLAFVAVRSLRPRRRFPFLAIKPTRQAQGAWILLLWMTLPALAVWTAGLFTYSHYFPVLYPGHSLCLGVLVQALTRSRLPALLRAGVLLLVAAIAVENLAFFIDLRAFLAAHDGAYGPYGTVLFRKQQAAAYLAERYSPASLEGERFRQLESADHLAAPQSDLPFLISQQPKPATTPLPPDTTVILVDQNRSRFEPRYWQRLLRTPHIQFGSLWLFFNRAPGTLSGEASGGPEYRTPPSGTDK